MKSWAPWSGLTLLNSVVRTGLVGKVTLEKACRRSNLSLREKRRPSRGNSEAGTHLKWGELPGGQGS